MPRFAPILKLPQSAFFHIFDRYMMATLEVTKSHLVRFMQNMVVGVRRLDDPHPGGASLRTLTRVNPARNTGVPRKPSTPENDDLRTSHR